MATYPPMSNDQRDAVTMLHLRDSHQQISYSEARTIIPENSSMHTNFVSSNPNISHREETMFNFNNDSQFLMHSVNANPNVFERSQGHQGLSLSLGTHIVNPMLQASNAQFRSDHSILGGNNNNNNNNNNATTTLAPNGDKDATTSYASHMGRIDVGSKYLKAAQELLEEVVSVKKDFSCAKNVRTESMENNARDNNNCELTDANNLSESSTKAGASELSSAEKQEVQNKLTKLLWMLDEVDRRYRQYYHQMHIVVSSFDAISGSGSAKSYTSLALQTISRHFRTLRDAINGQIHHARKSLIGGGEDYSSCSNDKGGIGISRLRYVDQQIRQQKALQQLGMMQPHTWRPQRGLPEASVTILRAWLFEHFLHPYPKDSDKVMLARQTGLTRSQVSNWFINARVRLWKPMIEEMYREEEEAAANVDVDMDSNSSSDNIITRATMDDSITREDRRTQQSMTTPTSPSSSTMLRCDSSKANHARDMATINGSDNFINPVFQNSVQAGPSNGSYYMEPRNETNEPIGILPDAMILQSNSHRFFGGYGMSDQLKRLGNVGGVSLTLGLQHEYEGGGNNVADMVTEGFVQVRGNNDSNNNDAYNTASFSYGGS